MRKTEFANGEYYHIYNRGVDKRDIFLDIREYERFLLSMRLLNNERDGLMQEWRDILRVSPKAKLSEFPELSSGKKPGVEFIAYCLNPNHHHFILKQLKEGGIKNFMHKLNTSYTNYFNSKHERSGSLFQGTFKSAHIDSNEYLLYLSAYVNKNNFIHGYSKNDNWSYSSLPDYLGKRNDNLINRDVILGQFKNVGEYKKFLRNNALYMRKKKELARYLIEE
jgi:putative transposase